MSFNDFIRPKLEFGAGAWSPWTEGEKKLLEKIQERFIRMLADVRGESYEEKLKDAGLSTLEQRRERGGDAIEVFKTLKGFNRVKAKKWFNLEREEARPTRRNAEITGEGVKKRNYVLQLEAARLEVRRNFFTIRAAKIWNDIPQEIKELKSTNAFKNAYDRWRLTTNHQTTVQ